MAGQIIQKLNKDLSGHSISDELHADVGSSAFGLDHDTFFDGTDLEIWTGAGKTGTKLVQDTDYSVSGKDDGLSTEAGKNVYTLITIINGTYQSGNLYSTYKTVGDYVEASDINNAYTPIGAMIDWPIETPPPGWLERDGSAISRTTYANLFAIIGTMYGNGDGSTTFNLPDHRGQFPRYWDHGKGLDPDASTRTDRGDGTTGDHVGTKQDDAIQIHRHYKDTSSTKYALHYNNPSGSSASAGGVTYTFIQGLQTSEPISARTADESRGKNIYVMPLIKY